ncbi:unnamed protein product [Prunus brigantina]
MNTWEGVEIGEEMILSDIINMYYNFFFFLGRGGGGCKGVWHSLVCENPAQV